MLNGFDKPLWYKIPQELVSLVQEGTLVLVPLQRRKESALIVSVFENLPAPVTFAIKEISNLEPVPADNNYRELLKKLSRFYFVSQLYFYQRIRHFLQEHTVEEVPLISIDQPQILDHKTVLLTHEQQTVIDYVTPHIITPAYTPTLIHGVTGSGKTEVYKQLINTALMHGKSAILLLPEVTLALQFEHLLRKQMPHITIIGFHSATKISEKRALWQALLSGKPLLIIGVHLPILLPMANLGIIIIDEEHEQGFQEKKHPKINSKEIALWRAHLYKIPIVMGSATPSLTSLYNVAHQGWKMLSITKRFSGAFPTIEKVILTDQQHKRRRNFWISSQLEKAVRACLEKKEQVIIFLNRRGYSFFVQCKSCGFIFQCPHCSVSLTLHVSPEITKLRCHYCDHSRVLPPACPECKAPEKELIKKGVGTQQVVQIFKDLFPGAVIERADMDSTTKKKTWQNTVDLFGQGKIDILIGTQTITKGYHFPGVTLVGVLWADLNLHFPLYNASETTLQQIIQVAGRAGRQRPGGKVIVQIMRDHPIFNYLDEQTYIQFCKSELAERKECMYPPFARIACIELRHKDSEQIDRDAKQIANLLKQLNEELKLDAQILGPALPIVHKIQNYEVRHIILKSPAFKYLHPLLKLAHEQKVLSALFIIVSQ